MHIMYIYTNMQVDRQTCCCSLLSFPHMKVLKHLGIIYRTKKNYLLTKPSFGRRAESIQWAITWSKLAIETLKQGVKYIHS